MSKRPFIGVLLTIGALALLLSFKTPAEAPSLAVSATGAPGSTPGAKSNFSGQVTGSPVQIPFGTVQVQVTMANGVITDVQAIQLPNDRGHSAEVSAYAGPMLRSEALQAQSAQIDSISGATYTSYGYQQSLQSALDQAH
jgi:uncharacterized protein with FMN-binding domain